MTETLTADERRGRSLHAATATLREQGSLVSTVGGRIVMTLPWETVGDEIAQAHLHRERVRRALRRDHADEAVAGQA